MDRQLTDAAALAGHLVPAGSMFAFLAVHRAEVFPDADYEDLFAAPGVGRPSIPATQMAAVMTLQALHDHSDRETAEAVRFDVRWKVMRWPPRTRSPSWYQRSARWRGRWHAPLAAGPVNPGLCQDRADQIGTAGGCQDWDPADRPPERQPERRRPNRGSGPVPDPDTTPKPPQNNGSKARVGASLIIPADMNGSGV